MTSLGTIPALRGLPPERLDDLGRRARAARFAAGDLLRRAGASASDVVLLLSGTVVATHETAGGGEVWPGRWTGPTIADKPAVLSGEPSPTGLRATTAVTARLLPAADFRRLLHDEPEVRDHVLAALARDALAGRRELVRSATLPAVARVATRLLDQDPSRRTAWPGSQDDLARTLGLSRVTVNRALNRLSRAAAVRLSPNGVTVTDRSRLADFTAPENDA
ncbi:Crp/Fnr family transcriptional regulator [Actinoplanes sp. CA-252034]|uniref:Crp/Fnr family transcriptional regulator n=1 Tax=Actinoplanes sp. CA-252034 TaxID=3239906 RepID=UPI003D95C45E